MKVLLVEDRKADIRLIEEAMQELQQPCELIAVQHGHDALAYLRQCDTSKLPRLILLDLNLPSMPGSEVLAEIKKHPQWRYVPVVMLSTSAAQKDIDHCYSLQADGYLVKPFGFEQLVAMLDGTLGYWSRTVGLS